MTNHIKSVEEATLNEIKEIIAQFKHDKADFEANRMELDNPNHQRIWASYQDAIAFWERKAFALIRQTPVIH